MSSLRQLDGAAILARRRTEEVRTLLIDAAVIQTDSHFVFKSGLHSADYINKAAIFTSHLLLERIGKEIAGLFDGESVDVVIGPTVGGAMLAPWVARAVSSPSGLRTVFNAFADKAGDGYVLQRGFEDAIKGKRVLVADDITSTGGSVRGVTRLVKKYGGLLVGAAVIWNRGSVTAEDVEAPVLRAVLNEQVIAWSEADCPRCKSDVPVRTDLGHGTAYLANKK